MSLSDLNLLLLSALWAVVGYCIIAVAHMSLVKRYYDRRLSELGKLPPMEALPALLAFGKRLDNGQFSRDMRDLRKWSYRSFFPN